MIIEQQISELRAELHACNDPFERRQIEAELELAQAELIVAMAAQDGSIDAEPPVCGRHITNTARPLESSGR
jgi:DNA repair exonuclease SbcCD ATPase subunit